jgi:hypothetical protein
MLCIAACQPGAPTRYEEETHSCQNQLHSCLGFPSFSYQQPSKVPWLDDLGILLQPLRGYLESFYGKFVNPVLV